MAKRNNGGAIKPCLECGRLIRPKGWTAEDHPGTITHASNGLCSACRTSKQRAEGREIQKPGPVSSVEANKRNLDAFLKQIHATRQRVERRQKIRMVIR